MKTLTLLLFIILSSTSVNAALHDRGNGLIYDDVLNITWLQDVNYAKTLGNENIGLMNYREAKSWVNNLVYAGYDDWRLPSARPVGDNSISNDGSTDRGYNITRSELGHMYYNNLGNQADINNNPSLNWNTTYKKDDIEIDFPNFYTQLSGGMLMAFFPSYWLKETTTISISHDGFIKMDIPYNFHLSTGYQSFGTLNAKVWAVRDGDVADIPIPTSIWLLGSSLAGLALRKKI